MHEDSQINIDESRIHLRDSGQGQRTRLNRTTANAEAARSTALRRNETLLSRRPFKIPSTSFDFCMEGVVCDCTLSTRCPPPLDQRLWKFGQKASSSSFKSLTPQFGQFASRIVFASLLPLCFTIQEIPCSSFERYFYSPHNISHAPQIPPVERQGTGQRGPGQRHK